MWRCRWCAEFVDKVKARAVGAEVTQSLTPGQALLRIVQQELTETLGGTSEPLNPADPAAGGDP